MLKCPRSYQARRRPHGVLAAGAGRRYSCDTRLLLAWPSRGQSQVTEATIDEDVETTEPGSLANLQPGHDSDSRSDALIDYSRSIKLPSRKSNCYLVSNLFSTS